MEMTSCDRLAAVGHHIHLEESRRRVLPVGESAHGDALPQRRVQALSSSPLPARIPGRSQHAIDGRGTRCQNEATYLLTQLQMPMSLHGVDQDGNRGLQPFPAHPVSGLPKYRERLPNSFVVYPRSVRNWSWPQLFRCLAENSNRVLPVEAGYLAEFVEDLPLVCVCGSLIACRDRLCQFAPG
jgi:hypothetical protein